MAGVIHKPMFERLILSPYAVVDLTAANANAFYVLDTYLKGFECDWRAAYPGVNAVTPMELQTPPDLRQQELIPVVAYAVKRKMEAGKPDYWDHATLLELAVLARDEPKALDALTDALAFVREVWEPETTCRNLSLIADARAASRPSPGSRW